MPEVREGEAGRSWLWRVFSASVFVAALALHGGCASRTEPGPRTPKAVLVMLDGCRADALVYARTPNLDRLLSGTWRPGYRCSWTFSGQTLADARPSSAANHVALATGVNAARTRVFQNGQIAVGDYGAWPTWLSRVVSADAARKALFAFSWSEDAQLGPSPRVQFLHDSDQNNARNVPRLLGAPDGPDATMYFIDLPDHGGHATGFYPHGGDYLNAVHEADRALGAVLDAIAARPTFDAEDWLVMVTADHGGYARSHGMWGGQASTIPLVVAGRNVPAGYMPGAPRHYDLTATVLRHFGIDAAARNLDGRVLDRGVAPVPRPLAERLAVYLPFSEKTPANAVPGGAVPVLYGNHVSSGASGGLLDGCLRLDVPTNSCGGVRLEGSERLAFENGADFAVTLWAKLPAGQRGDAPLFANKDWRNGANPGIVLVSSRATDGVRVPGVGFNAAVGDGRRRIDLGTFDVEPGKWTFYAVTRGADGVLTVYQGTSDGRLYWICERAGNLRLEALPFHIGQDGTGRYAHTLAGDVDEFALWTRSLDGDEVRRVFEAGRHGVGLGELVGASR